MEEHNFNEGDAVICTPKNGDFNHKFSGEIVSIKSTYMTVRDMDDNYFDVDFDQVEHY